MGAPEKGTWNYIKALLSEKKDGAATGTPSMTRVALILTLLVWAGLAVAEGVTEAVIVPQTVEITLWGLIGLKGVTTSAKALKGSGG